MPRRRCARPSHSAANNATNKSIAYQGTGSIKATFAWNKTGGYW
ncbi:MAG: hypothetical protein RSB43_11195 [Niameybacter sp.]